MGTKKSALSYEASLGACISFAGRVLGSPLMPSQVCTKDALASIVVEAHRFGQQVGKACSAGNATNKKTTFVDPCKLLKRIQTSQREPEWDRPDDAMITNLVFQDLTWDSHGSVSDMLEMELLELDQRARESNASVCVLLSLTAPNAKQSAAETAILWLPVNSHHGNNSNSSGKKQYLLYVCPGRVKVVKSVLELLKKLRVDVQTMHVSDAVYRIWTLSRRATTDNNPKKTVPSNQQSELENTTEMQVRYTARDNAVPVVKEDTSKEESRYGKETQPLEAAEEGEKLQQRYSFITREALQAQCPAIQSMITFALGSQEKRRQLSESSSAPSMNPPDNVHEVVHQSGSDESASVPSAPEVRILDGRNDEERIVTGKAVVSPRSIISASCSRFLPTKARTHEPCGKDDEQCATTWRSLDSKLNKLPVQVGCDSADTAMSFDGAEKEELPAHAHADQEESEALAAAESLVRPPDVVEMNGRNEEPHSKLAKVRPDAKEIEAKVASSIFKFLQKPVEDSTSVPLSTSAKADAVISFRSTQLESSSLLLSKEEGCASNGLDSYEAQHFTSDASDPEATLSNLIKTPEAAALEPTSLMSAASRDHIDNPPVAKTGSKNYKSKLGNRVWWELQCAAQALQAEPPRKDTVKASNCGKCSHVTATGKSSSKLPKDSTTRIGASNECRAADLLKVRESGEPLQSHLTVDISSMNAVDPAVRSASPDSFKDSPQSPSPVSSNSPNPFEALVSDKDKLLQVSRECVKSSGGIATPCIPSSASHVVESGYEGRQQLQTVRKFGGSVIEVPQTTMSLVSCMAEQSQDLRVSRRSQVEAPPTPPPHCLTKCRASIARRPQSVAPPTPQPVYQNAALQNQSQPAQQTTSAVNALMHRTKESSQINEPLPSPDNMIVAAKQPSRWSFTTKDDCDDDDDDDLAQNQWASTRTSYLRDDESKRSEGEQVSLPQSASALQFTDREPTKTPFNVHGHVPIRAQKTPSVLDRDVRRTVEDNNSVEGRHDAYVKHQASRRNSPRSNSNDNFKNSDVVSFVDSQKMNELRGRSSKQQTPHVATFIPIDLENPASKRATPLHKVREESLVNLQQQQQQKQKRALEKTHSTLSAFGGAMEHESSSTATASLLATKAASGSMERDRLAALQAMAQSTCENFIVLLKSTRELKFRALYEHHTDRQHVVKLFALTPNSPPVLTCGVIGQFFKYNTGKKEFTAIDSRSFTMKTDACALKDEIVFKKKSGNTVARLL
ncbi:Calmodulin-regulated spectrin-associated protein 3, partial [Globisporangium splendens]